MENNVSWHGTAPNEEQRKNGYRRIRKGRSIMGIATREAYGQALVELIENKNVVVLDADLAQATKTVAFKKACPERFF